MYKVFSLSKLTIIMAVFISVILTALPISSSNAAPPKNSQGKILMVGHAHIDPVWRWTKDEGYQEVFATFRSGLDRMNEYPGVTFVASSAQFYAWVEEANPEMFAEIKKRVEEGRWNIVGGWWIEPDINCPSGESLVRQGLYGQRFFMEKFGRKVRVGMNPDSFGHPGSLPQILRGQELESYFFMRPGTHEKPDLPAPIFLWRSPDGSEILTIQIISSYNGGANSIEMRVKQYKNRFKKDLPEINDYILFYGVGNHGGGPTKDAIEKIEELGNNKFPAMQFGTLQDYVDLIKPKQDDFPVVAEELQHHARGCYSAHAGIKQWNRQAENALLQAEKASALCWLLFGSDYPQNEFTASWKKVLLNQFHDILAGSSLEQGYIDAHRDYGYAMSVANEATTRALHQLAAHVGTADIAHPRSQPILVFNPNSFPVRMPVEIEMQRLIRDIDPVLLDANGNPVPYQAIRTAAAKVGSRIRIVFPCELGGFGYHLYRLDFGMARPETPEAVRGVQASVTGLENELVRVKFDTTSGWITSYFDKQAGREILSAPAAVPIVLEDWDDTWGHKIVAYDRELGHFQNAKVRVLEWGPERGRVQIQSFYGNSFVTQDFFLYRGSPELYCNITINWHEKYKVLKLGFPTKMQKGELTYSIPYGFVHREMNGEEEPGQTWVDISGQDDNGAYGFALLNDSKCGYDVKDGEIRLTVLHSTAWSHHNPAVVKPEDGYRYMEQGIQEFSYRLVPHEGDWRQAEIPQKAEAFLQPPLLLLTTNHAGTLPLFDELISISAPNVIATVAKQAEDGDALVLRFVEVYGQTTKAEVEFKPLQTKFALDMKPTQIQTVAIPLEKKKAVRFVNLLER